MNTVGLKTYIWNNNLKCFLLLAFFPLMLFLWFWAFISAFFVIVKQNINFELILFSGSVALKYCYVPLIVGFVWLTIAYFFHNKIIERITGAVVVNRLKEKKLYDLLENLCILRGLTLPKLAIIESKSLNAFSSGISPDTYRITLTRGIINDLSEEELEAVIAHELAHILNNDTKLLVISAIFVGIFSFSSDTKVYLRKMFEIGGKSVYLLIFQILGILIISVVAVFCHFFSLLINFALSRKREFLADAGAIELTKNPKALISALQKVSGNSQIKNMPKNIVKMCINQDSQNNFAIFATHPTIEERIEAIKFLFTLQDSEFVRVSF